MTHTQLIDAASAWLRRTCAVVITDMSSAAGETPDAIGWRGSMAVLVECKASRPDFIADRQKAFRRSPALGMGRLRYFCAPPGVCSPNELPDAWGLLIHTQGKTIEAVKAAPQECAKATESLLLLSALRRIGQTCPSGVSIKAYKFESLNRATLGVTADPVFAA